MLNITYISENSVALEKSNKVTKFGQWKGSKFEGKTFPTLAGSQTRRSSRQTKFFEQRGRHECRQQSSSTGG